VAYSPTQRTVPANACPSPCGRLARRANFRFTGTQISGLTPAVSFRQEGRSRVVTNAGWDVVDARASACKCGSQGELNLVSGLQARKTNDVLAYGKTVWS
jgi:hypothetical protein